jgi:hypothetical protein
MSGEVAMGIIAGIAIAAVSIWLVRRWSSGFKAVISEVVTQFMEAGKAKNVEAAHACCSRYSPTKEEVAELIEGSYDVFASYERVTIKTSQSASSGGITGIHSDAYASGAIIYTGGEKMPLKASFVKEEGVWKIAGIQIGSTKKGIVRRVSVTSNAGPMMTWGG